MVKVALSGEDHAHVEFVGGFDHFGVALGAARLDAAFDS